MFARWTIRSQMYFCATMMLIIVGLLSLSGFQGVLKYRQLIKNIRSRANELPLSTKLSLEITDLRDTIVHFDQLGTFQVNSASRVVKIQDAFARELQQAEAALVRYRTEVEDSVVTDPRMGGNEFELQVISDIEQILRRVRSFRDRIDYFAYESQFQSLDKELQALQTKLEEMPLIMKRRMDSFAEAARTDYHTWLVLSAIFTAAGLVLIGVLFWKFNDWFFKPLNLLVDGSRRVAQGDFEHRIKLNTQDELAELAAAMNDMTRHFCEIRDDLDRQVRERSNEVIRNEQLAGVGFLAAGVAHEINNPLASIAWSAESLESRLLDWLDELEIEADDPRRQDADVILKYMRRIQDEAFRVKGITDGLLDFSRLGSPTKTMTDLRDLVENVVEMVRHLSKHRRKKITIHGPSTLLADLCPQSIKQVALNLITNALDSVDDEGQVDVYLIETDSQVQLRVVDNGCGMTPEVLNHIFEPFFTQKRDQQGTGLGLSIAHRIVTEHEGTLVATSLGPQLGSVFCVTLPKQNHVKNIEKHSQAA